MTVQQEGRYKTVLSNTSDARKSLYNLVEGLMRGDDFRLFEQTRRRLSSADSSISISKDSLDKIGDQTFARFNQSRCRGKDRCAYSKTKISLSDIGDLIEDRYVNDGYGTFKVILTKENNIVAKPISYLERILDIRKEKKRTYSELVVEIGTSKIHAYTNDKSINDALGEVDDNFILTHEYDGGKIDYRNIAIKIAEHLSDKTLKVANGILGIPGYLLSSVQYGGSILADMFTLLKRQ